MRFDWIVIIGIGAIIVTIIVVSISTRKRISSHYKLIGEITESAGKVLPHQITTQRYFIRLVRVLRRNCRDMAHL